MGDVELHVPPDVVNVGLARLVVTAAARRSGMDPGRVEDLRIAVSEATTNAIHAHQRAEIARPVVVAFGARDGRFTVRVEDAGPGFQPPEGDEVTLREWTDESGLGVTLIRGLADEVTFVPGDGTQVHIAFTIGLHENLGRADG